MADLTISFTIGEDDVAPLAYSIGYQDYIPDPDDYTSSISNTETMEDYLRRWVMERWQNDYETYLTGTVISGGLPIILDIT